MTSQTPPETEVSVLVKQLQANITEAKQLAEGLIIVAQELKALAASQTDTPVQPSDSRPARLQ